MANRRYSDEEKAAVLAALLGGQSIYQVAEAYRIPEGTVKKWSAALAGQRAELREDLEQRAPEQKAAIGDLLVSYLEENLRTLREQVIVLRDPEWIKQQSAADIAVLHGVLTDKAVRLLDALGGGSRPAEPAA